MSRIGSMMSVGKQALANAQTGLQTTSHNVANANTEGYTRQRVEFSTAEPVTSGNVRVGQGAKTAAVNRIANSYLARQIQEESSKMGAAQGRENALDRVEQIYNESINKGLNHFLSDFFNAFREFSNNPESQATRALVKEKAAILADDFHRVHNQLLEIQEDVDHQVSAQVEQINGYTKEIADLNGKIQMVEVQGMPANDERDRRELLVKKLGELINIRYAEGDNGKLTVTAGNAGVLVSGSESNELRVHQTAENETKRDGQLDVFFKNGEHGSEFVITNQLRLGQIGGALDARDNTINDLHKKMDHLAFTVSEAVNAIHEAGYDRYNNTGTKFFDPLAQEKDASANISLNKLIAEDPGRIAAALIPNAPADNRVANGIASIQNRAILKDGTSTIDDFFNGMVGQFAVITQKNRMTKEHQENIVNQLKNVRESISGVSLDEETTDMIKYQKAFDASARLIRTADEMFDTVLNLKRL